MTSDTYLHDMGQLERLTFRVRVQELDQRAKTRSVKRLLGHRRTHVISAIYLQPSKIHTNDRTTHETGMKIVNFIQPKTQPTEEHRTQRLT